MPEPILGLEDGPETKAFRTCQWAWTTDPRLASVVRQWAFLEGAGATMSGAGVDLDFDSPPAQPEYFPTVRAALSNASEYTWGATDQLEATVRVNVRIWTPGTHQDDLVNLWHALRVALRPRYDPARYKEVQERFQAVVRTFGSVADAGGPDMARPENAPRNYLTAQGMFRLHLLIHF